MPTRFLKSVSVLQAALLLTLALGGCALPPVLGSPTPTDGAAVTPAVTAAPSDRWADLLQQTPYPYASPLPLAVRSAVDGVYAKLDPSPKPEVNCLRCPDYLPEGGIWRIFFDKGIYRIYYDVTGWRILGSYTVDGERLLLFNDPNCANTTGVYSWALQEGRLTLAAVEDACAIGLRAANLAHVPWQSCHPPNQEAGISDHWSRPPGC
jgi:hypothetical protein